MLHEFSRTELLLGKDGLDRLKNSKIIVFGVGGVGSFAAEALARSGVGHLTLVDYDIVTLTNLNRQIHAVQSTIGRVKVEVMSERLLAINPRLVVKPMNIFYGPETEGFIWKESYDYIVDAIDTVSAKIALVEKSVALQTPIVVSMGAGNKLDPTRFKVADISKTHTDPIAKVMRKELKQRGITKGIKAVFSDEHPMGKSHSINKPNICEICDNEDGHFNNRQKILGSVAFVPAVAGMIIASVVIRDLCGISYSYHC